MAPALWLTQAAVQACLSELELPRVEEAEYRIFGGIVAYRRCPERQFAHAFAFTTSVAQLNRASAGAVVRWRRGLRVVVIPSSLKLDEAAGLALARDCGPALEVLEARSNEGLSDATLGLVAQHGDRLRVLDVRGCPQVTLDGLERLGRLQLSTVAAGTARRSSRKLQALEVSWGPSLRHLDVWDIQASQATIKALGTACPRLARLVLAGCDLRSVNSFDTLVVLEELRVDGSRLHAAFFGGALDACQVLEIVSATKPQSGASLRFTTVTALATGLKLLDVSGWSCETGALDRLIANSPALAYLICADVQVVDLRALADRCPNLVAVDLSRADVADEALGYLVDRCPQLESIKLCDNAALTDKGLGYLLRAQLLCDLDLSRCASITPPGVLEYLVGHPALCAVPRIDLLSRLCLLRDLAKATSSKRIQHYRQLQARRKFRRVNDQDRIGTHSPTEVHQDQIRRSLVDMLRGCLEQGRLRIVRLSPHPDSL